MTFHILNSSTFLGEFLDILKQNLFEYDTWLNCVKVKMDKMEKCRDKFLFSPTELGLEVESSACSTFTKYLPLILVNFRHLLALLYLNLCLSEKETPVVKETITFSIRISSFQNTFLNWLHALSDMKLPWY